MNKNWWIIEEKLFTLAHSYSILMLQERLISGPCVRQLVICNTGTNVLFNIFGFHSPRSCCVCTVVLFNWTLYMYAPPPPLRDGQFIFFEYVTCQPIYNTHIHIRNYDFIALLRRQRSPYNYNVLNLWCHRC